MSDAEQLDTLFNALAQAITAKHEAELAFLKAFWEWDNPQHDIETLGSYQRTKQTLIETQIEEITVIRNVYKLRYTRLKAKERT